MEKQKKWFLSTLLGCVTGLVLIILAMVVVDPYFHYHGRIPGISYRLYYERYINPGIAQHFEYDAIVTGSSMNQNFKTSLMDELWGTNAVKMTFSGAAFYEIMQNLERAFTSDNEIKLVLWGLDYNGLYRDKEFSAYKDYPNYLYDKNLWNDVKYVLNKELIFQGLVTNLLMTVQGEESTSFDAYGAWDAGRGWDSISLQYTRSEEITPMLDGVLSEEEELMVRDNIGANIVELAQRYPDTQFVIFYTPYSAVYWESIYRDGTLLKQLECERIATEMLLECENVKLFNFHNKTDITGNVELYRDKEHYVFEVNDMILQWIDREEGLVTKENYMEIINWEKEYYTNYDYDSLYE